MSEKQLIPFRTIEQSLMIYRDVHAPFPSFGMDIFCDDFSSEGIVLLSNNGKGNKGIPIRNDHYALVLCLQGEASCRINHHRFQITPQSAHLIQAWQIHSFSNATNDYDIYVLLFEKSFLAQFTFSSNVIDNLLCLDMDCSPKIVLDQEEFTDWKSIFYQINKELLTANLYSKELMITHVLNLILKINRKLSHNLAVQEKPTRKVQLFYTFRNLIESYFHQKKTVAEYAELMNLSAKHLSETIKEVTGHTALYYIHERILHEAEYLLVYSNSSVKEIAYVLHFETPSHFGRFFKKKKKITPLKFRAVYK